MRVSWWTWLLGALPARNRVELALPTSDEERLHALLRSVSDVIAILEADGTIRYVSPAAERAWGCPAEDLLGTNVLDRTYTDDCGSAIQLLEDIRHRPGDTLVGEVRLRFQPEGLRDFEV